MKNNNVLKLLSLNVLPVLIIHLSFAILDRMLLTETGIHQELRMSIGQYEIPCYLFLLPLYLVVMNSIFHHRKRLYSYFIHVIFMFCGVLTANIGTLIYNSNTIPVYFDPCQDESAVIFIVITFFEGLSLIVFILMSIVISIVSKRLVRMKDKIGYINI